MEKETTSIKKKLCSLKFWFTLVSTVILAYIIFANRTEFEEVAELLALAPLGYCITNVWQKKVLTKKEQECVGEN